MADRQDYLRQLIAPLDVVLPEHRAVLGDLLTARARGILAQFPTAQHLAHANPRTIRRAAQDAGARGFSLNDATGVRDRARRSLYSAKAAAARAQVGRTLVSQLQRLTRAIDEVDHAATTLLPPASQAVGPPTPSCCRPSRASARRRPPPCSANSARSPASPMRGRSSRMSAFIRSSTRAATARRRLACRPWALALRAILSTSPPSMPCAVVASGAPFISARRPRAKRPSKRWSWSPSSCFIRCTPCSSTGSPTTPSRLLVTPATIGF